MQPTDILANMARLKSSPSSANMANYDDIFAGPAAGHVPTAFEQQTGDANADAAETAMGAGPAIDALRHVSDEQRRQTASNLDAADEDFQQHGLERGLAHSNVRNQVADIDSEAAAHRGFLPWAESANFRDTNNARELAQTRYLLPAEIQAQGNVQGHVAEAQGRIGAAQTATQSLPQRGLMDALSAFIEKNGHMPDDAIITRLQQLYGGQPGQ